MTRFAVGLAGVALVVSGCAAPTPEAPAPTPTPRAVEVTPSAQESFADDFATQFPDLLDYAGVGVAGTGVPGAPLVAGDRVPRPALGTLTLPLGLAALNRTNDATLAALARAAAADPRSPAVAQLWARLGGGDTANFAVQRTLNKESISPGIVDEPTSGGTLAASAFGRSAWDVGESALFAASVPCRPGGNALLAARGLAARESTLGPADQIVYRDVGTVEGGQVLLRRVAVVTRHGRLGSVAMSVRARDEASADQVVARIETWLAQRIDSLPRGTCAGRGKRRPPTTVPSSF